jgi:hypothetical protein
MRPWAGMGCTVPSRAASFSPHLCPHVSLVIGQRLVGFDGHRVPLVHRDHTRAPLCGLRRGVCVCVCWGVGGGGKKQQYPAHVCQPTSPPQTPHVAPRFACATRPAQPTLDASLHRPVPPCDAPHRPHSRCTLPGGSPAASRPPLHPGPAPPLRSGVLHGMRAPRTGAVGVGKSMKCVRMCVRFSVV